MWKLIVLIGAFSLVAGCSVQLAEDEGWIDFTRDPETAPAEQAWMLEFGSVPELVARYESKGLRCSHPPDVITSEPAVAVCKGRYSETAVTVTIRGHGRLGRTQVATVRARFAGGKDELEEVARWSRESLGPLATSDRTAEASARWISDHVDTGGTVSLRTWRLSLRPRVGGLGLVLRGPLARTGTPLFGLFETPVSVAARFAPILQFARNRRKPKEKESFLPLAVDRYVRQSALCRFRPKRVPVANKRVAYSVARIGRCRTGVAFADLPTTPPNCKRCFWALDVVGAEELGPSSAYAKRDRAMRAGLDPPWTVYYAYRPYGPDRWVLEYWLFYAFNDYRNVHEGDWEMIGVDLEVRRRWLQTHIVARRVAYSAHHSTLRRNWSELTNGVHRRGDHPFVFVALGSHANYFTADPAPTREPVLDWRGRLRGCLPVEDVANDFGPMLKPSAYHLEPLPDVTPFAGGYGRANFVKWQGPDFIHGAGHPPTHDPRSTWRWSDPFRLVIPATETCKPR